MAIPTRQSLVDCRQSHIRQIAVTSDQQAFPARQSQRRLVASAFERLQMDGAMSFLLADHTAENGRILNAINSLCDRVGQVEDLLFEGNAIARMPSDEKLATIASSLARMRNRRERFFPADLFAEPSWDILLDLFVSQVRGIRVPTTSLCLAANAPQATALRHIAILEEHGLLSRFRAPEDKRLVLVQITAKGYGQMRKSLGELVKSSGYPLPE